MRTKRNYVLEAHELGKSYASMSRESGYSIQKLKSGKLPYNIKKNLYRRTTYHVAIDAGLGVERARALRTGSYSGDRFSSVNEMYEGTQVRIELKHEKQQADTVIDYIYKHWWDVQQRKHKIYVARYNNASPKQRESMRIPHAHLKRQSKAELRKLLAKELQTQTLDEYEERVIYP